MDNIINHIPDADAVISYIHSITSQTTYAPWQHKWKKSEKIYKIIYVIKGEYFATVDGECFHIKENDVFYSYNRQFYSRSKSDELSTIAIYFEHSADIIENDDFFKKPHLIKNCSHLKNKFTNIYNEFCSNSIRKKLILRKHLYDILDNIYSEALKKSNIAIDLYAIKNAIEVMEANYASENITVEYLASLCNYTPVHFINLFKKIYSTTPKNYIINLRIDKAKELLMHTNFPINKISEKVGYTTTAHFSATFKNLTGISPLDFRKQFNII